MKTERDTIVRPVRSVPCVVDRLDWLNVSDEQLSSYKADLIFTCDTVWPSSYTVGLNGDAKLLIVLAPNKSLLS